MTDTLISRLANCRAMASERLPAADVATIDEAIRHLSAAAPAQVPQPLSDEQIAALALETVYEGDSSTPHRDSWAREIGIPFARALETAHGIKGTT